MNLRPASSTDIDALYAFASNIPELRVSHSAEFMSKPELLACIESPASVFQVAFGDGSEILGFVYANIGDLDRGGDQSQACIVYLAVSPNSRGKGLGQWLLHDCIAKLRHRGVCYVYAWANPTSGVIPLLKKNSFDEGHSCVWMDTRI
jgi:GNAT superfamily N-acetyltransferase